MDGLIPTVGAIGTFVVAVVALLISIGATRRERKERARSQRASFAESVYRFLDGISVAPPLDIPALVTQIKRPLDQIRDEAAAGPDGAAGVSQWVSSQTNEGGKLILSALPATSERRKAEIGQGWSVFQWGDAAPGSGLGHHRRTKAIPNIQPDDPSSHRTH